MRRIHHDTLRLTELRKQNVLTDRLKLFRKIDNNILL